MTTELSADPLERYEQLRNDPWLFLKHCVWTEDEVDLSNPIKPYPAYLDYLRFIARCFQQFKKIAIPKSRRMTISWTVIGLVVWHVIFHRGRHWAFTSKKENDAAELVERAEFILKHIPPAMISPELLPKMKHGRMQTSPPALDFPDLGSSIEGFPQGADQLRQRGFSGILEDECAFQEESEGTYAAAEPTIRGGGYMIKISSRSTKDRGFFKKIVFDKINHPDTRFAEVPPVPAKSPMEGVLVWKNPENEFLVIDLHYTANPAKRGAEFREGLKKTLPAKTFRMEYEKSWETFDGRPVEYCEDFNPDLHLTQKKPEIWIGPPLILGWDSSGLTPAVLVSQIQDQTLVTVREIIGMGMGASRFCPFVAEMILTEFPQITDLSKQTISFIDPAGLKKSETNERTYLSYIVQAGFSQTKPGPMTWEKRKSAVSDRFVGLVRGKPKALIYELGCPIFVAGLKGGYRYPDSITDGEPKDPHPIKDIHSHPQDAYQYKCGGLAAYIRENYADTDVPIPSYGFQKHTRSKVRRITHG